MTHSGVNSGNGDERSRGAASAVHDVDLRTTNVELSTSISTRNVEGNLHSDQLLESEHLDEMQPTCSARTRY